MPPHVECVHVCTPRHVIEDGAKPLPPIAETVQEEHGRTGCRAFNAVEHSLRSSKRVLRVALFHRSAC